MKIPNIWDMNIIKNLRIQNLEKTWHVLQNTISYLLTMNWNSPNCQLEDQQFIGWLVLNSQTCWLAMSQTQTHNLLVLNVQFVGSQIATYGLAIRNSLTCPLVILATLFMGFCDTYFFIINAIQCKTNEIFRELMQTKNEDICHICAQDFWSNPNQNTRNVVKFSMVLLSQLYE